MSGLLFILGGLCALLLAAVVRLTWKLDRAYRRIRQLETDNLSTLVQAAMSTKANR